MDSLTVTPESTGLLVVDVQERLAAVMPEADRARAIACIELLVEAARAFAMPVFVTEQYVKGLGPTVERVQAALATLERPAVVAEKTIFSAMAPPEIARAVSSSGLRSIVVVGMEAHICVFQTARELCARGYSVHVPFDAVSSRDPACRSTALALLARHGVSVTTTETLVFDFLRDAKHAAFRALSARVKDLPIRS